MERREIIMNSG